MKQYQERLQKLQKLLKETACDGLIVDDQINLYYLTGLNLSAGKLLVHTKGATLMVDNRYYEMCKKSCPFPVQQTENKHTLIELLSSPKLNFLINLGFNSDNTTYGSFLELQKQIEKLNKESKREKGITLKPIDNLVAKLRCIKDPSEIDILREASHLGSEGFDFVCSLLKEGITEAEIAVELEIFWKRRGGKTLAFDPIIAFGENSSMPHYRVGNERLQKGKSVLIDIGVNYENYHSDMTRVVFFGEPDPKMLIIFKIVKKAQQAALELCRPNTSIGDLDVAARDYIAAEGYGEKFTHSLGHGVGLEIHESPTIRNKAPYKDVPLKPGMVITIEPGIYLPGIGGVRIEDTIVITDTGYENLTNRPSEPIVLG